VSAGGARRGSQRYPMRRADAKAAARDDARAQVASLPVCGRNRYLAGNDDARRLKPRGSAERSVPPG
jgi:hypothetical protein